MIITISGDSGTGTTTLARRLSSTLELPYFYAGSIFRRIAEERKLDILHFIDQADYDLSIDKEIDQEMLTILRTQTAGIVEGRLSGYLAWREHIPSLRILLTASPPVQATRIAQRERKSYARALAEVVERDQLDWQRYHRLYAISIDQSPLWYQMIVDTDHLGIEEVYQHCLSRIQQAI